MRSTIDFQDVERRSMIAAQNKKSEVNRRLPFDHLGPKAVCQTQDVQWCGRGFPRPRFMSDPPEESGQLFGLDFCPAKGGVCVYIYGNPKKTMYVHGPFGTYTSEIHQETPPGRQLGVDD